MIEYQLAWFRNFSTDKQQIFTPLHEQLLPFLFHFALHPINLEKTLRNPTIKNTTCDKT